MNKEISMKGLYAKIISFWFVLLALALLNAVVRELTYKPFLEPYIGMWAHQISSLTGILLFFGAIYFFIKRSRHDYSRRELFMMGIIWMIMTIIFEVSMNIFIRKLSAQQILETYYFWKGETWIFVLISLIVSPLIIDRMQQREKA